MADRAEFVQVVDDFFDNLRAGRHEEGDVAEHLTLFDRGGESADEEH
jgi:hypothetical protein